MEALLSLAVVTVIAGCDTDRFAANTTISVIERAAPAGNAHWDYDLMGEAIPSSILQLEGLLVVAPDNEDIMLQLAQVYVSYAYGWVEDELERTSPMNFERQEYLQTRARWIYLRARNVSFKVIRQRVDGFDAARGRGLEAFQRFLARELDHVDDAPMLFWAGFAWGSAINVSREDPELIADLAFARAMVERSRELDRTYFNAGASTFLAVVSSSFPEALGGNPDEGRTYFEEAVRATDRRHHLILYNYARTYATTTGNRELFVSLLREVLDAPDQGNEFRLSNKIARRRARRLLANIDEYFDPID
jgi:hypothetical protein